MAHSDYPVTKSDSLPPIDPEILNRLWMAESIRIKENEEMAKGTRKLYNVYVVDPEGDGSVVFKKKEIIATSTEVATRKAVHEAGKILTKDLDDYDFIVEDVGDMGAIRAKV